MERAFRRDIASARRPPGNRCSQACEPAHVVHSATASAPEAERSWSGVFNFCWEWHRICGTDHHPRRVCELKVLRDFRKGGELEALARGLALCIGGSAGWRKVRRIACAGLLWRVRSEAEPAMLAGIGGPAGRRAILALSCQSRMLSVGTGSMSRRDHAGPP